MFGRNKKTSESIKETHGSVAAARSDESAETTQDQQENHRPGYTAPKGRPTPSRKQQVSARKHPLVPEDRKAAKEANKKQLREQRLREQQALQTGDERFLPLRDKGPQRRYIRDFVDARFNIGDFVIILVLIFFIMGLFSPRLQAISVTVMWVIILIWIIDTWLMWRRLKAKLIEKFGSIEPGSTGYAINRVMMIRRFRLPKPQVRRGEYPK
ncbi:DUF3043 domain-containing protein [Rothia aerolata]|uniref:DUF3043 domain-containing protein n=1 Tax=Rothia aerolata TaxID=1812262 RepID=A0A917IN92_9MICC|nr:DUF3043 domain-containing protein [Rothia aerolata]GGH57568.1 hypothetical protein GCM10007359_02840 [Rothia aerolata]